MASVLYSYTPILLYSIGGDLHGFGPARDDLVWREDGGFAALIRGVEDGAVDESSFVMTAARVTPLGYL